MCIKDNLKQAKSQYKNGKNDDKKPTRIIGSAQLNFLVINT